MEVCGEGKEDAEDDRRKKVVRARNMKLKVKTPHFLAGTSSNIVWGWGQGHLDII